ncbi:MAG: hypothetical protein ACYC6Y_26125, partial [Thermoguttaceae bacterium]
MENDGPKVGTSRGTPRRRPGSFLGSLAFSVAVAVLLHLPAGIARSQTESSRSLVESPGPTVETPRPMSEPTTPGTAEPALEYILVYGPTDELPRWRPGGTLDHRPVAPGVFREMLRRAHRGMPPTIRSARFEARFENNELIDGRAVLEVEHLGPIETSLPLSPCNLAIGRATWSDRDGEVARLGLGSSGRMELRVSQGGRLEFDWSLRGERETLGGAGFEIRLPPCPSSHLILTLPEDRIPMLTTLPEDGVAPSPAVILPERKSPEAGKNVWEIALGGQNHTWLRIAPKDDPEGHGRLTELREELVYSLSPGGLTLTANLRFDILGQPLRRLELIVPSELTLISVQDGDAAANWGELAASTGAEKRVVIEPGSPLR